MSLDDAFMGMLVPFFQAVKVKLRFDTQLVFTGAGEAAFDFEVVAVMIAISAIHLRSFIRMVFL